MIEELTIEERRAISAKIGMRSVFSSDEIHGVLKQLEPNIFYFNGLVGDALVLVYRKNNRGPTIVDRYTYRTIQELKDRIEDFKLFVLAEAV